MSSSASSSAAGPGAAPNDVIATYPDVESARAAITLLERHGVEGGSIELDVPGAERQPLTNEAQRDADMEATGKVGKGAAIGVATGAIGGAILGVVLGALVSIVFDLYSPLALAIGGGVALGAAGTQLGFFYGGARGLPVSEAWGESYNAESSTATGEPRLAIHGVRPERVDEVVQALRGTGALSLQRSDDQGRLTDA